MDTDMVAGPKHPTARCQEGRQVSQGQRAGAFAPTHASALPSVSTKLAGAPLCGGVSQTSSSSKDSSSHNQVGG